MQSLPKPNAVIFDWDNTLVDTFPLIVKAHSYTRTKFGLSPFTIETASQYVHKSARNIYPEWFGENSDTAIKDLYEFIQQHHIKELKVIDGSLDLIKILHSAEIPCAIVSNKRGDILRTEVSHLGWEAYFDQIIGSGDAKEDKPDPEPAYHALNAMNISTDNIWYIGDSESDFKVCQAADFLPIYVKNRPLVTKETLKKYGIEHVFENTKDLSKSLEAYFKPCTAA